MEFADRGLKKRAHGNAKESLVYFEQALRYELAAIDELDQKDRLAWAVLHRSAGTLALDCRDFRQAEKIVATALAQEPHPAIAEELRDLWQQIHFQRHLDLKGITLQEEVEPQQTPSEPVEIRGILRHADAMREDSNVIQVIDGNKRHTVQVPQGMMNDIVRPMWDSHVIIQGIRTGEHIILEDIRPDDSA